MMVKKSALPFVVIVVVLFLFIGQAGAGLLKNGDFSSGLDGWSYEDRGPGQGDLDLSSGYVKIVQGIGNEQFSASLTTGGAAGPALISLYQWFEIPADAFLLEFDVAFGTIGSDGTSTSGLPFFDFFQVFYLDDILDMDVDVGNGNFFASSYDTYFIDIDAVGPYDPATSNSLSISPNSQGWYNCSFDISHLKEREGKLFFTLWDDSDGVVSQVYIANVFIAAVPEPATMLLFACGLVGLIGFSRRRK